MVKVPQEDLKEKLACSISPSADFVAEVSFLDSNYSASVSIGNRDSSD